MTWLMRVNLSIDPETTTGVMSASVSGTDPSPRAAHNTSTSCALVEVRVSVIS